MADAQSGPDRAQAELELVERARSGEDEAKRRLLTELLPTLRAATRSILGRGPDADDATQQAAVDVLRGLHSFRGDGGVSGWARTIAVRAALRGARSSRRHLSAVDPDGLQAADSGRDRARLEERLPRHLRAYLQALPERQREALVLRHALGYTVPEIAELLETSVNTIKSRLLAARKDLRRRIRQDEAIAGMRRQPEAE